MNLLTRALLDARASGRPIVDPGPLAPTDLASAHAVQAEVFRFRNDEVAGWKVALRPDVGPIAAPIARQRAISNGGTLDLPSHGVLGIEVEVAVRLGGELRRPTDRAGLLAAVDAMLVGVEVCATRFADVCAAPFLALLADDLSNHGYALGDATARAQGPALQALSCRVRIDGRERYSGLAAHPNGDPLTPALAWLAQSGPWPAHLEAGQFITTGALCGLIPVPGPCRIEVEVTGLGSARFELRSAP